MARHHFPVYWVRPHFGLSFFLFRATTIKTSLRSPFCIRQASIQAEICSPPFQASGDMGLFVTEMGKNLDSWILILILEIVLDFDFENKSKLLLILILNLKRDHDNSWYWFWFWENVLKFLILNIDLEIFTVNFHFWYWFWHSVL